MLDAINWHSFFFLLFSLVTCAFAIGVVVSSNIVRMAFYLIVSLGATSGLFFLAGAPFVGAMQLLIYVGGTLVLLIFGVMLTAQGPFVSMKTRGGEWVLAAIIGGSLLAVLVQAAFSVDSWRGDSTLKHAVAVTKAKNRLHAQVQIRARQPQGPEADYVGVTVRFVPGDDLRVAYDAAARNLLVTFVKGETTAADVKAALNASPAGETFVAQLPPGSNGQGLVTADDWAQLAIRAPRGDTPPGQLGLALLGYPTDSGYLLPFEIISVHLLVVLIGAAYLARTKRRAAARNQAPETTP